MNWVKIINSSWLIHPATVIISLYLFVMYIITGNLFYAVEILIIWLAIAGLSAVEFLAKLLLMNRELLIKIYNQKEIK